jgi:transposase
MRFVPIKGTEQQAVLMMHRVRQLVVRQRTMVANAIRGHLAEFGIVIRQGVKALPQALPKLLEETDTNLPPIARSMLALLSEQLRYFLRARKSGRARAASLASRQRAQPAPGGHRRGRPDHGHSHRRERGRCPKLPQCAAVRRLARTGARTHSSGGKQRVGSISKRGDTYLRMLLIRCARSSLRALQHRPHQQSPWLARLLLRRHPKCGHGGYGTQACPHHLGDVDLGQRLPTELSAQR